MNVFNEFGTPPEYLNDQYRVENNFGATEQEIAMPRIQLPPNLVRQAATSVATGLPKIQTAGGQQQQVQKAWWQSYYGGWKLFTLVPLAGAVYYMRNKNEKMAMRVGKAALASSIYAPYLMYVGGKYVYDKLKK